MRVSILVVWFFCLLNLLSAVSSAQDTETLKNWPYFKNIEIPESGKGLLDVVLDAATLDKAREDHGDLRLYDSEAREIPYALRIPRRQQTRDTYEPREFNRSTRGDVTQVSYDLSGQVAEHNELLVDTEGMNFRRRVEVEGSRDGAEWATLVSYAYIFRFSAPGGGVDERRVPYPVSRYQLLRVSVHPDPQADQGAPRVRSVRIRRTLRLEGEILEFPAHLEGREGVQQDGRPASAYRLDLNGRVPLEGLVLTVAEESFSRPYRLEAVNQDAGQPRRLLASGSLTRRGPSAPSVMKISFPEQFARRLVLKVTDDRNPPLSITEIKALSAARQVIFDPQAAGSGPLRLYYGHPKAVAPHYDFADSLRRPLPEPPARLRLGAEQANPLYEPEPEPLTERAPWLIYLVLGAASLVLFIILRNLARTMGKGATRRAPKEY